jgi:WD40 repeat protein/ABC-type Fe3+/spermidine/putrescine transport system ATPase subunit
MARHALVVGLSQYPYIGSLDQPPIDAEKVAQILEQHGEYTVTRLPQCWNEQTQNYEIDPQQTVSDRDLALALKKLLIELPENGATIEGLVYFAGHGFTFNSNMGVEKGAIATSNTKITTKDGQVIDYENAVSFSDLNDVIQKSNLQSLVLILDCCHSGYFIEKEMTKKSLYSAFIDDHRNYYCISACQTREKSTVLMGNEHSIFSTAVLNGLDISQANQQGKITGDRLYDYIQSELTVKGPKWGQTAIKMGWGEAINIVSYPQIKSINAIATNFNADNPYLGLYAFQAKDEPYFHGRKRAIQSLISRLDRNRFLAVIGSSGCGKSSLVKAGLLPELQRDRVVGSKDWQIEMMTPGDRPLDTLLEKLEHLQKYQNTLLFIDQCEEIFTLCKDVQERQRFFQLIAQEASVPQRLARVLVGIRGDFLDQCAEFPAVAKLINRVQPTTYCVEGLALEELQLAIEEPARLHGVSLEAGLAGAIAHDVINQPGALPLLQYALKELWEVCVQEKGENLLTWSSYQKIDGVAGALSRRANNIYNSLTESEQKLVQQLFLELAEIGDGNTVTKRSVQKESLVNEHPQLPKIIDDLTKHRLIAVTERKDVAGEYQVYIDLAHESLFEKWDLLKSWIESDRHNLRLKRKFQNDCQDWLTKYQRSADALLTGAWLGTLAEWITTYQPELSPMQQEFFDLSIQRRDQERLEKEEKQRQLLEIAEEKARAEAEKARAIAGELNAIEAQLQAESEKVRSEKAKVKVQKQKNLIVIISGLLIFISVLFLLQGQNRQLQIAQEGKVKALVATAQTFFDTNQQLESLMKSVEALQELKLINDPKVTSRYLEQLSKLVYGVRERNRIENLHEDRIRAVSVSKNGKKFVTAGKDKKLGFCSITGQDCERLAGHNDTLWKVSFSNQENTNLVVSAGGNLVVLWQINPSGRLEKIKEYRGHEKQIYDIAFSSNDNFIASTGEDGKIIIWQVNQANLKLLKEIDGNKINFTDNNKNSKDITSICKKDNFYINSVSFDPKDENIIVYGTNNGLNKLLNWKQISVQTLEPISISKCESISQTKFNKQGDLLVSADYKGSITLWKYPQKKMLRTENIGKAIDSMTFSPDDKFLVFTENYDIKFWDVDKFVNKFTMKEVETISLIGHKDLITDLSFSSYNNLLLSSSGDQTVRMWNWTQPKNQNNLIHVKVSSIDYLIKYGCDALYDYLNLNKNFNKNICL